MNFTDFQQLQQQTAPIIVKRDGKPPIWNDADWHQKQYAINPKLYALMGLAETTAPEQQNKILFQLLKASRVDLNRETRNLIDRVINVMLAMLAPENVLTIFLALRRLRANHKHTTRAIVRYLLNHPAMEELATQRRASIVDCLEHALGKNVMRACARFISENINRDYIERYLSIYVDDMARAEQVVQYLYYQKSELATTGIDYQAIVQTRVEQFNRTKSEIKTVTATNRGDIAATLFHIYRGGNAPELSSALDNYLDEAAIKLPRINSSVGVVLDASLSTRSYGEREYCYIAQSVALVKVLERSCAKFTVHQVGGECSPPVPMGETDLASGLIDILANEPDIVLIISDGYENYFPGDLASVAMTLPNIGIKTPVIFCHSKFSALDDISLRTPASDLQQLEFWHQDDFGKLFTVLLMTLNNEESQLDLTNWLQDKLVRCEQLLGIEML